MTRKCNLGLLIPNEKEIGMHQLFLRGMRQSEIARIFGVTRERTRQILKACFGVTAKDNKVLSNKYLIKEYLKKKQLKEEAYRRKEQSYLKIFGCSEERATYINRSPFTVSLNKQSGPAIEYFQQKKNAGNRGIEWNITLPEWWETWLVSGKYDLRGRCKGEYVMARYGDIGPYQVGNVYISESSENIKDIYKYKTDEELAHMRLRKISTHCRRGHEMNERNTYVNKKTGGRDCLECHRIRQAGYKENRTEEVIR